ncbi:MAG: M20/M25/M40 family metallo-hydrolase [Bacteroidetes bacterium]|nr:M20/M25/M40 family metallo-hydrolase [Bacteroidota bacterium]
MKFKFILLYVALLTPLFYSGQTNQVTEKYLKKQIEFLSSDRMKGRQTGSKELAKAGKYIERQFKKLGLQPKGSMGYRQDFIAKVKKVKVNDSLRKASNIIGFLDNGAEKTIVIGAHYDHIGHGELGNSKDEPQNLGKIHNGADDNASGVAGLLALAKYYTQNKVKETNNILFIAFSGEELGLLGSKYFVDNPTLSLNKIHWMLNMDMIGRYNPDNGLSVIGYGTSKGFEKAFDGLVSDIHFNLGKDGRGGSDQTSFYDKKIPVLFFHTGGHPDYHKHGDDSDKINYKTLKSIIDLEISVLNKTMEIPTMDFILTN